VRPHTSLDRMNRCSASTDVLSYVPSLSIALNVACLLVSCGTFAVATWLQGGPPPPAPNAPAYGYGPLALHARLALICSLLSAPVVVVYYAAILAGRTELACATSASGLFGVPLVPLALATILLLLIATYRKRFVTRGIVAQRLAADFDAERGPFNGAEFPCFLSLPADRGLWLPPLFKELTAVAAARACPGAPPLRCISADAWHSISQSEGPDWLRINLALEGVDIDRVKVIDTDFERLAVANGSVDVLFIPMTRSLPWYKADVSSQKQAKCTAALLRECQRVLHPGSGRVCSLSFAFGGVGDWEKALVDAGFVSVETPTAWLWTTFLPCRLTTALSPIGGCGENGVAHTVSIGAPLLPLRTLFPPGSHWRARDLAAVATCALLGAAYALLMLAFDGMEWPVFVDWTATVANLLLSSVLVGPLAVYFALSDLTRFAAGEAPPEAYQHLSAKRGVAHDEAAAPFIHNGGQHARIVTAQQVLWRWLSVELPAVVLALTALQLLTWVPGFVVDALLIKVAGFDPQRAGTATTIAGIVVFSLAIPLGRRAWAVYAARVDKERAVAEAAEELSSAL
jgi:hypothetical protein